jgi:hypothetical protein
MAATQMKRIPLVNVSSENIEDNITVEEFLASQCDAIISVSSPKPHNETIL